MHDWSGDLVLNALQDIEEPVGSLIGSFPGRDGLGEGQAWLEEWFVGLATCAAAGDAPDAKKIIATAAKSGELSLLAKPPVTSSVRLLSIEPRFFRGFRGNVAPIELDADLVVIEGRNSSGKTSLSEAIEWLITGQLSRRVSGQHGHARELADCIGNEFRPEGETTSVTLRLRVDGEELVLKRTLLRDYSTTASDIPESELFANGLRVSRNAEDQLRDRLFAGIHPILMQHNLRRFVHDDPTLRRQYFERLLQVDELTALIEKAVIGPTRLKQIVNPNGGAGLSALNALINEMPATNSLNTLKRIEKQKPTDVPNALSEALVGAASELALSPPPINPTFGQWRDALQETQRSQREARLPLLAVLNEAAHESVPLLDPVTEHASAFRSAADDWEEKRAATNEISESDKQVSRAFHLLVESGLVDVSAKKTQHCPVCAHSPATLSATRINRITAHTPLIQAADAAGFMLEAKGAALDDQIDRLVASAQRLGPRLPKKPDITRQLKDVADPVRTLATQAIDSAEPLKRAVGEVEQAAKKLKDAVRRKNLQSVEQELEAMAPAISTLALLAASHREHVDLLEEAVGSASRDDGAYRLREKWLEVAGLISAVASDVAWENAKAKAKEWLDALRDGLIALRGEIIEHARETFSAQITQVWHLLRNDSGARFSQLSIPDARGRGYKLEFELKAVITDGSDEAEVDALRVFSESQVNVIGLAACITRAKLLGHKLMIFDDPVQSMDEEHFRSFAAKLLPALLADGGQVVILTHSETFSRRIHENHYDRASYVTLVARSTKRIGCQVEEGNRRISERLKNAERLAREGDLQNAWRVVRLSIERLFQLAMARTDPKFDPETWRGLTAEDMWNKGVNEIVEASVPGAGKRLKDVLRSTVAGAHDVAATSETDVVDAVTFMRGLLGPLGLGAG